MAHILHTANSPACSMQHPLADTTKAINVRLQLYTLLPLVDLQVCVSCKQHTPTG